MANTNKIEKAAVRAVDEYLDKCPKLESFINTNDKTPIWDGDIYVYKNDNHKNENFFARVPLQIKGTENTKGINFFRLGRDYIDGYKKVGGTAFFLVQKGTGKVFYALLSVEDIDILLQQTTKTIKIDLQEVPQNPKDFEDKLYAFAANRNSEKVENTSPKEIKELVDKFEEIRGHLDGIGNKDARIELEGLLDNIKNLKDESAEEKGTIGWRDKFIFYSRKALDLATHNNIGLNTLILQFQLGKYLQEQKQYHLAEKYYKNALDEYRKLAEARPSPWRKSNVAKTLNNLAVLHSNLTRYDEAEKEYQEALKIRRELAKANRDAYIGDVARTLGNLGNLHSILTRYDEAEKEYKKALDFYRELAKTNRDAYIANVAATLDNLGILHKNLTLYDEAEKEHKEALEIRRELAKINPDAYSWDVANTLNNFGELYQTLSRLDEAKSYYKEALKIRRELVRVNREANIEYLAETLYNYASLLQAATNRKAEAKKTAVEALSIYKELAKAYPQIWNRYVEKTEQLLEYLSNNS